MIFSSAVSAPVSRITLTVRRPRRLHHLADVVLDERVVARLERADVDDHVDLVARRRAPPRAPRTPWPSASWRRAESRRRRRPSRPSPRGRPRAWPRWSSSRTPTRSSTCAPRRTASCTSAAVASALSSVWSIMPAMATSTLPTSTPAPTRQAPSAAMARTLSGRRAAHMPQSLHASCDGVSVHGTWSQQLRAGSAADPRSGARAAPLEPRLDALGDDPDETVDVGHRTDVLLG